MFESLRNKSFEVYKLYPAHFLSAPQLVWQVCLKKTKAKLELLSDADMLLMTETYIMSGICPAI